jgi:demethylmenaquinone methyltransferase/2-methoxy-6-polyprenyl-1,4-benzoquinol methylase
MLPHHTLTAHYATPEAKPEFVTRLFTRSREAGDMMRCYWETMDACVRPASILDALRSVGLTEVQSNTVLDLFSEYTALKARPVTG